MGNACQDTFIGSKSLSVNKSRVPRVKKVPQILKKFHHIQSTHVFHLRNWSWFALELVEIWDPKRTQLCHQSEALGRYHCFWPSRAAQSHWTGTHFHVSRRRGWMAFLQGWMSWEVTMTRYDWCLPMVPMISDVSKTSLSKQNWIDWSLKQFKQTFRSFKRLVLNMTLPLVEGSSKHSATMSIVEVRI